MIIKINITKQDKFFKNEQNFFHYHKKQFVNELTKILLEIKHEPYVSEELNIANSFYDALFDYDSDCFEQQLFDLKALNTNGLKVEYIFANLVQHLISDFIYYKKNSTSESIVTLIRLCINLQNKLVEILSNKQSTIFDIAPTLKKQKNIKYLYYICRLKDKINLISHHEEKTYTQEIDVIQIGKNSLVVKTDAKQTSMIKENCNSYIFIDQIEKKYFSTSTKILCEKDNIIILENVNKLETHLLLNNRRYPRASVVDNSLIYISSDDEHITGNLIDISEGGIGVMSPSKSHFKKGQDIVAFISYKDLKNKFNLNFESSGILTSVIGKEHAFRYGIALELSDEKRKLVRNLVKSINQKRTQEGEQHFLLPTK